MNGEISTVGIYWLIFLGCGCIIGFIVGSWWERMRQEDEYEQRLLDEAKFHEAIDQFKERQRYYNQDEGC